MDTKQMKKSGSQLAGVVTKVFHASPDWSSGLLKTASGDTARFSGKIFAKLYKSVVLDGRWVDDPTYGQNFEVKDFIPSLELNLEGLVRYLSEDPAIRGVGLSRAQNIVDKCGHDFEKMISDQPIEFMTLSQLNERVANNLKKVWARNHPRNATRSWLYSYGLSNFIVEQLIKQLGNSSLDVIQSDPYVLLDKKYPGFGFSRVDAIARRIGIPPDHPSRLKAVIMHTVSQELMEGHCWTSQQELLVKAAQTLSIPQDSQIEISSEQLSEALRSLLDESKLAWLAPEEAEVFVEMALRSENLRIGLPELKQQESDLANLFKQASQKNPHSNTFLTLAFKTTQKTAGLNDKQEQAVKLALSKNLCLISGVAGAGKTHVVSQISEIFKRAGLEVALTAPTGKAARRMEEVCEGDAKTIHRLLRWDGKRFGITRQNQLQTDVIVVDEFSMVDVHLAWHLFEAIDLSKTSVIMVGDHNQLPPVGPGNILRDLIQSEVLPTVILDEVVRQAGELPHKCAEILKGEVPDSTPADSNRRIAWAVMPDLKTTEEVLDYLSLLFEERLEARGFDDILKDVQVLSPQRAGPIGTENLNRQLQKLIQKKLWEVDVDTSAETTELLKYDKVIQTKNNYNLGKNGVMNGTIGTVVDRDAKGVLDIKFDGEKEPVKIRPKSADRQDIQLAYALTIHKSQGSEFPCVVLVVHSDHYYMHHRNLFYTGVTRAKTTALTIGDSRGIRVCAQRIKADKRRTFLSQLLQDGNA